MSGREVLKFDDLKPHLLLQNGNFLYKVPYHDGWAILVLIQAPNEYPAKSTC